MSTLSTARDVTRTWNRPMLWLAGAMAVMTVVSLLGLVVDDRILGGMPIWAKPLKFSLSVGIYAVTWAWMTSLTTKAPRTVRWTSAATVALISFEMVLIYGQVIRGKASHFNNETSFDSTVFQIMGITIGAAWIGTLVLAILLMRSEIADGANRWAIRLGAAISVVGIGLGALMTGPTSAQLDALKRDEVVNAVGAHSVGVPDGGPGLPILGWSTTGGDLRIPHFIGMHALQILPLLAMGLALMATRRQILRSVRVRTRLILTASAGYAGLVALVTWQALRGQSIVAPDGLTLATFGLLVGGVAAGTAWALQAREPVAVPA